MKQIIFVVGLLFTIKVNLLSASTYELAKEKLDSLRPDSPYSAVLNARADIKELIPTDKVRATNLLVHLAYFEGSLYRGNTTRRPKEIFKECRDDLKLIQNEAPGVYRVWDTICMALWFSDLGVGAIFQVNQVQTRMNEALDRDLNIKPSFLSAEEVNLLGGGIYRVVAGIFLNEKSFVIMKGIVQDFNGSSISNADLRIKLYSKAIELSKRAIETSPYGLSDDRSGFEYGSNYRVYAQSLAKSNKVDEAIEQVALGLEMIEERKEDGVANLLDYGENLVLENLMQELN